MLAYRLVAHGIGGRTVRELNEGPDAAREGMEFEEFVGGAAYLSLEPFLEERSDAHTAMLMAQQYNMNRGKGRPARAASHFMPRWAAERGEKSLSQLEAIMRMQYLRWNGDPAKLNKRT